VKTRHRKHIHKRHGAVQNLRDIRIASVWNHASND
jgi:ribosomal protein L21